MKAIISFISLLTCLLLSGCQENSQIKKIGIIVPIEHKAMTDIVTGFIQTLKALSPYPLSFKVANAQGDINMERAIIEQMKNDNYALIVPIGTDATQLTSTLIKDKPIVSLAASITDQERKLKNKCNMAIVHDEISSTQLMQFIHQTYPDVKNISLIHSASDKVMPEITATQSIGKQYGITIKPILVSTLNDLYSSVNNMPEKTEAILVLKDSLIVSGISTLAFFAEKHHLPLITSDQGSVQDGAAFALGVHENQIGAEGAKLAANILSGTSACQLSVVDMNKLTVFINAASMVKESQSLTNLQATALHFQYEVEVFDNKDKTA